jgi:glycosyltransferase involved in cell wall biosynthesis
MPSAPSDPTTGSAGGAPPPDPGAVVVIVAAHNEADRLPDTLAALRDAFPAAQVVVADDASTDATSHVALQQGVQVVRAPRNIGKGGANTLAAEAVLSRAGEPDPPLFVLCDGDLGASARHLSGLTAAVRADECDLAIGVFARKVGGGVGAAVGFSRWATRRRTGIELRAPISGQRAMRAEVLRAVVPFAPRYGMETGMNIDAGRSGFRIGQVELDLEHRATGRTLRGFLHRFRQLRDFALVYVTRR